MRRWALVLTTMILVVLGNSSLLALEISSGGVEGSFDTTISLGMSMRTSDRDPRLIGRQNGGTAHSVNGDNGNLNYGRGELVSSVGKVTHDLLLGYQDLDLFLRCFYFYDRRIMDGRTARTPITRAAKNEIGRDFTLLDAYAALNTTLGGTSATLRIGNQVLSWGESTLIPNGINTISPYDLSKLRLAGAELREGLTALPLVDLNFSLTDRLSVEGFYMFMWDKTMLEPEGTFFSTSDIASTGGEFLMLGFGRPGVPDNPPLIGGNPPVGTAFPRRSDREPRDSGQFGVALRWYEPRLAETEFGFYFTRLHSRLPLLSSHTGSINGLVEGDYASSAGYFLEYPEEIDTYGVSFNTLIVPLGTAVQGEISHRTNQPLQADGVEVVFATLSPLDPYLDPGDPDLMLFGRNPLGPFAFDEEIRGFRRKATTQAQVTATQAFGPRLGADQFILLGEVGVTAIHDMEDTKRFRYESPGTNTSADDFFTLTGIQPETQTRGFPDPVSWGYRVILRADLNNAIGAVNLQPKLAFAHDVSGTTPGPLGNFVEGRKALTAFLDASFLISWQAGLSYTNSFGASEFNLINDRDFVTLTVSYAY